MANPTNTQTELLWAGTTSVTISAAGTATSDAVTVPDGAVKGTLTISVDNQSTAATGDYVVGKILGASSTAYATALNTDPLVTIDTFLEDPAIVTVPLSTGPKTLKLYINSNAADSVIAFADINWRYNA